jgi:amino acid adenylation domain-containing protein
MPGDQGGGSIGERLARVALRLPDRVAVVEREAQLTYAALDARANAVAARIHSACARPGFVALLFEAKIPAVAALFGASRSARAYVPLDAGDPDQRLGLIVADSEPAVLFTERALMARARALAPAGCPVLALEDIEDGASAPAAGVVADDALANLYYTSGSTGQPKGVSQTQRNVLYFADAYARALRITQRDRVSLLYTLSFSASMMDIFGALFNGATLCAYDVRRDGVAGLGEWLDRERVSVLHAVPTVFRGLLAGRNGRPLEHLRAIDLGGETVYESDVELFRRHTGEDCVLVNHLAATECNVVAQYVVRHDDPPHPEGILPVGRSPAGVSVEILRSDGNPARIGEVGDLVVRSAYLSPGYWRRPDLDAAAFSEAADAARSRRYRTGDTGRIDAEGNLHFLGRTGSRVKIRGQSIDLSEVEAALAACHGVVECAVVACRDGAAEPDRLAAHLVVADGVARDFLAIRRQLAKRLPPYMLPGAFAFADALPRTATGKIDRGALAAIPRSDPSRSLDLARDDVERAVAEMFAQLTRTTPIGRDDDFFLLGGDSLSLFELQSRVLDRFGVAVTRFYEDATVAGIAARIRSAQASGYGAALPVLFAIKDSGSAPPLCIVHGRLGQPFVSPHFLRLLGDDLPVWAFQARGLDGREAPNATIEAMADDYIAEMRKRRPNGPYFLAALCAGALIANVMARNLRAAGETVLPLLLFDPPEARMRASISDESLLLRIKARKDEGRFLTPIDDANDATAAVRTARAFELAIWQHEPVPYDGAVYMLSSGQRMAKANPRYLRKLFSGPIERFEVGATHDEALDPRTPAFAAHLAYCLRRILAEASGHPPHATGAEVPRLPASAPSREAARA